MNDYPSPVTSEGEYGKLPDDIPDELKKSIEACHDKLTIKQLNRVSDYFSSCASKLRSATESEISIEDFEKLKKEDVDDDMEEGEG